MIKSLVNFKYQYSWILIPLFIILYLILPNYRKYLNYPMFCIGTLGIIMPIYAQLSPFLIFLNILGHLPLFIGLSNSFDHFNINPTILIFYLLGIFSIIYVPFWPYIAKRQVWVIVLTIVSLLYIYLGIYTDTKLKVNAPQKNNI